MELFDLSDKTERVILVGVQENDGDDTEESLQELAELAKTAGAEVVGTVIQKRERIHPGTYVGKGKIDEIRTLLNALDATGIICDDELSPVQMNHLQQELESKIMDRTLLILDIFASRAVTKEGKIQVELAQLRYRAVRLVGLGSSLSRLGGGIGTRGPGEKKLEMDRRLIKERISQLKKELEHVKKHRELLREGRKKDRVMTAAIVGYTNAGKSTILNRMVEQFGELPDKTVMEKDMLFATLETSVRSVDTGHNKPFFLTDTVGFINKLPHGLVKAFRSTLEEVKYADLLIQVVDFSDENYRQQMQVTADTLKELEAGDIPQIIVYNKADKCEMEPLPQKRQDNWYLAAGLNIGIRELAEAVEQKVYADNAECVFLIPYSAGNVASYLMEQAQILSREYREDGILIHADCHRQDMDRYREYIVS